MIWSVSTSALSRTVTRPSMFVTGSIVLSPWSLGPASYVYEVAFYCRCCCHLRADQVRSCSSPLAAFEIPVRCGCHSLSWCGYVGVHAQAHRAAGRAPVEACCAEDLVQALGLGLGLHLLGAGDDHCVDVRV